MGELLPPIRSRAARLAPKMRKRTVGMEPFEQDGQEDETPGDTERRRRFMLTRRNALLGMGAVAGFAAVDVGGFAYAGGWLRPDSPLTPPRFADRFEHVYGRHDGFRRNHAK